MFLSDLDYIIEINNYYQGVLYEKATNFDDHTNYFNPYRRYRSGEKSL